jgi:hypothetical protein
VFLVGFGVLLGVFSIVAAIGGRFSPGPMVSPYYLPALIGTQWWYIVAGLLVIYRAVTRPRARTATPAPVAVDADADADERTPVPAA